MSDQSTPFALEVGHWYKAVNGTAQKIVRELPAMFSHQSSTFVAQDDRQYHSNGVRITVNSSAVTDAENLIEDLGTVVESYPTVSLKEIGTTTSTVAEETFESMRIWGEEVFGPTTPKRIMTRAKEEWDGELEPLLGDEWTPEAVAEAADVVIIMTRVPGLWEAIQKKMAINRQRKWNLRGDGTGYHVKETSMEEEG